MALHCTQCGERQTPEARFCPRCGAAILLAANDALVGKVVADRYLLTEKIGQGSSGTIYRAEHTTLHRKIAVKILHHQASRDDAAVERFRREATTIGQIDNDHLLQVIDFGRTDDQRLFFAMELLEGETLDDVIRREGCLDPARTVKILRQIVGALGEAHGHGYIHRDLRPRNVFLAVRRGERDFVKLLDFGLAKLMRPEIETRQTALGMTFGDPHYMAPEQARGDTIDARTDVFSLGAVAYQMLVGDPPFQGSGPFDVLQKVLDSATPRIIDKRPDCPAWLDALVWRTLQKAPAERFASMAEVGECLRNETAPPVPTSERAPPVTQPMVAARPAPAEAPMKPAPQRTLIMPTALPASVAAVPAPEPAPVPVPIPEGVVAKNEVRPRDPVGSTTPAEVVSGVMRAPTQVTQVQVDQSASIVVDETIHGEPTGPQRTTGDDGWFSDRAAAAGEPEFEEEAPRRVRSPLVIGMIVGGVSLAVGLTLLLWPRAQAPAKPGPTAVAPVAPAAPVAAPPPAAPVAPVAPVSAAPPVEAPPPPPPVEQKPVVEAPSPAAAPVATKPAPVAAKPAPVASKPTPVEAPPTKPVEQSRPEPASVSAKPEPAPVAAKPKSTGIPKGFKDPFAAPAPSTGELDGLIKSGRQKLAAGDLGAAQGAFAKARELDGKNADALAGLGEVAFEQGDYIAAAANLKAALRLSPNRSRYLVLLGQAYYKQGRPKEAVVEYRRALKVDPTNQEAQRSLELAEKKLAQGG